MPAINNPTTSGSINTATDLLADGNQYGRVAIQNQHASAAIYVNIGATAVSTGTVAGVIVPFGQIVVFTVNGRRVSVASGTASVPLAFWEYIDQ